MLRQLDLNDEKRQKVKQSCVKKAQKMPPLYKNIHIVLVCFYCWLFIYINAHERLFKKHLTSFCTEEAYFYMQSSETVKDATK